MVASAWGLVWSLLAASYSVYSMFNNNQANRRHIKFEVKTEREKCSLLSYLTRGQTFLMALRSRFVVLLGGSLPWVR